MHQEILESLFERHEKRLKDTRQAFTGGHLLLITMEKGGYD